MKPSPFAYFRARNALDAVALLDRAGDEARFLAGGQSLVPMMNFRMARPTALIDLSACADLAVVKVEHGMLCIGAMVTQHEAQANQLVATHCPLIGEALSHAGPVTVRHRATIGGTLANGYPLAELPCVAACLDARVVLQGRDGERIVPAGEFFIDAMVTSIGQGELLREVRFPLRSARGMQIFREVGNHAGGAALAMVSVDATPAEGAAPAVVRVAASGVDTVPIRLPRVERALCGGLPGADVETAFRQDLEDRHIDRESAAPADGYAIDMVCQMIVDCAATLASCIAGT